MRLPTPPGVVLNEGEEISTIACLAEWIAYLYERHRDVIITVSGCMLLYDALWAPALWLLPISIDVETIVAGLVIDALWASCVLVRVFVWGMQGTSVATFFELLTCGPWELIGYATHGHPIMWARVIAKVPRAPVRHPVAWPGRPAARA